MKPWNVLLVVCAASTVIGRSAPAQERAYRSPYRVEFTFPTDELVGDLERTERGDYRLEGEVPFPQWYTPRTMERWRAWGPPARDYPPPPGVEHWTAEKERQRVVAVAAAVPGIRLPASPHSRLESAAGLAVEGDVRWGQWQGGRLQQPDRVRL